MHIPRSLHCHMTMSTLITLLSDYRYLTHPLFNTLCITLPLFVQCSCYCLDSLSLIYIWVQVYVQSWSFIYFTVNKHFITFVSDSTTHSWQLLSVPFESCWVIFVCIWIQTMIGHEMIFQNQKKNHKSGNCHIYLLRHFIIFFPYYVVYQFPPTSQPSFQSVNHAVRHRAV